jgi:predicted ATP-dependent endonuclease of OLD family
LGLSTENPPVFNSSATNFQDEFEKIQRWKDDKFIVLGEAGHGIRSMIRLLTSVLEPVNEVIMIDEPEMHLYPSQKRWLGKQLVNLAKNRKKQIFLVTHDPMVLQGVLDANTKTNIFRVERNESNKGVVKACELDRLTDANAMRNQDQYLQGLFYQRCIAVEGASDRSFYQNMIEDYVETHDKDLGFVACGGKGSTKHMANIVSKVGLNTAFIYDFDALLFETTLIKEVFSLLNGDGDPLAALTDLLDQNERIKNTHDVKERNKLIKEITGYSDKGGISGSWADINKEVIGGAIDNMAKVGIFIVPNGTIDTHAFTGVVLN